MGQTSVTVPCKECCSPIDPDKQCYRVMGFNSAVIGNPGCTTTVSLSQVKTYITTNIGVTPSSGQVHGAYSGSFNVDCSNEESGFCRDSGAGGTRPWSDANFRSPVAESGETGLTYDFVFEDCGLDDPDFLVRIRVDFVGYIFTGPLGEGDCETSQIYSEEDIWPT